MILILFAKSIAKNRKLLFWCSTGILFCFLTIVSGTTVVKRVKTLEEGEDNPKQTSTTYKLQGIG